MMTARDPIERLANTRHEFGEHGGVNMSVEASTTFTVMKPGTMPELFQGRKAAPEGCYLYGRHFNPTVYNLGRQLAAIEGTEAAYCTASGMAAISAAIFQLCGSGQHIVASNTVYGGTYALMHDFLPAKANIRTSFVDITDLAAVKAAMTDETRVIYAESIANPTLRLANIPALSDLAHLHGVNLIIDNTFSPLVLNPVNLGADVVVHSMTKFINGASDIIAGAVCGTADFIQGLMDLHLGPLMILGPTMDPTIAAKISLRIPHLALRMAEHARRAQYLADKLQGLGVSVTYPGLAEAALCGIRVWWNSDARSWQRRKSQ
jgi:methionine-gamma-lyase